METAHTQSHSRNGIVAEKDFYHIDDEIETFQLYFDSFANIAIPIYG